MHIEMNFGSETDTIQIDNGKEYCAADYTNKVGKQWPLVFLYYLLVSSQSGKEWDSQDYYDEIGCLGDAYPDDFPNNTDYPVVKHIQVYHKKDNAWHYQHVLGVGSFDDESLIENEESDDMLDRFRDEEGEITRLLHSNYKDAVNRSITYLNNVVFRDINEALNNDEKNEKKWKQKVIASRRRPDPDEDLILDSKKKKTIGRKAHKKEKAPAEELKIYYFHELLKRQPISWRISGTVDVDLRLLGLNPGDEGYIKSKLQKANNNIIDSRTPENRGQETIRTLKDNAGTGLSVARHEHKRLFWNGTSINKLAEQYGNRASKIDKKLLPKVSVSNGEETYDNLGAFIAEFTNNEGKYSGRGGIAIVEGKMGSGKTYSLSRAAKELCDGDHYAFIVQLYMLQHEGVRQSLSSYLCNYMQGEIGNEPLAAVQTLIQRSYELEELPDDDTSVEKPHKVIVFIDCVDESYTGSYESLASEISSILSGKKRVNNRRVKYRNCYFILATRDADSFKRNINLTNECWQDIVDVRIQPLDADDFNGELRNLMIEKEEFRTPLFASYYSEIQNLQDELSDGSDASRNVKEYGDIKMYKHINNYYDLFDVKTRLLIEHARRGGKEAGAFIYSDVIPYLAFNVLRGNINDYHKSEEKDVGKSFDMEELYDILSNDYEDEKRPEYQQFGCRQIDDKNHLFRQLSEEKLTYELLKTGIVSENELLSNNSGIIHLEFEHQEYMQFLAAVYASKMVMHNVSAQLAKDVLSDAVYATSYNDVAAVIDGMTIMPNGLAPEDKLASFPYGYYLVRMLSDYYDSLGTKKEFNPLLYMLEMNIGYEKAYDVWSDSRWMLEKVTKYYKDRNKYLIETLRARYKKPLKRGETFKQLGEDLRLKNRRAEIFTRTRLSDLKICGREKSKGFKRSNNEIFENPVFLNATNAFLYTTITNPFVRKNRDKKEKRILLENIVKNLELCAERALFIVFNKLSELSSFRSVYHKSDRFRKDGNDFFPEIMDCLIDIIRDKKDFDISQWPFDIDLIGRVYSDLGAAKQQQGKDAHDENRSDYEEYLYAAENYHLCSMKYRDIVSQIEGGRYSAETGLIRSYITLGTDKYFQGLYAEQRDASLDYFSDAVNNYYRLALLRQGIVLENAESFKLENTVPLVPKEAAIEHAHADTEPHIIFIRVAGCYYEMWKTIKDQNAVMAGDLLHKQFVYVRAAYMYLYDKCLDSGNEKRLHPGKLELNTVEINNLLNEYKKKYCDSLSNLVGEEKEDAIDLMFKICNMYKELHKNTIIIPKVDTEGKLKISSAK